MNSRPLVRTLVASAAIVAATALAGCNTDNLSPSIKSMKPISDKMVADIEHKNMTKESPILVRVFKQESELEVWKEDREGRFALLKSYPICRWSGELGPKIKEGDRQAPEGFYNISPGQMNPNSQYYLAFNLGYPNDFDKAHGRTGAQLMVHGDCSSRGCYSMTDEQIEEIYALARESFFGGQRSFQVQAYPFRMTAANLAKHRANPNMPFWKMLKQGNDQFEVTRLQPKVDVCEKRYVFNAQAPGDPSKALSFSPAGKCPVFEIPQEIASAASEKQRNDEVQVAELVRRIAPAPIRTGVDGGMHPVFANALDENGQIRPLAMGLPGTIPSHVNPPRAPAEPAQSESTTGTVVASAPNTSGPRVASADGAAPGKPGFFGNLFASNANPKPADAKPAEPSDGVLGRMSRLIGLKSSEPTDDPAKANDPAKAKPAARPAAAGAVKPQPKPAATQTANAGAIQPAAKPQAASPAEAKAASAASETKTAVAAPAANGTGLLPGSQPIVAPNSFDSRWSTFR